MGTLAEQIEAETAAMLIIAGELDGLPVQSRARVLDYVMSIYGDELGESEKPAPWRAITPAPVEGGGAVVREPTKRIGGSSATGNLTTRTLDLTVEFVKGREKTTPGDLAARYGLTPGAASMRLRTAAEKGLIAHHGRGHFAPLNGATAR
jgi:hypothetical protein